MCLVSASSRICVCFHQGEAFAFPVLLHPNFHSGCHILISTHQSEHLTPSPVSSILQEGEWAKDWVGLNLDVAAVTLLDSRDIPSKLSARSRLKKGFKTHHRAAESSQARAVPWCCLYGVLWLLQDLSAPVAATATTHSRSQRGGTGHRGLKISPRQSFFLHR